MRRKKRRVIQLRCSFNTNRIVWLRCTQSKGKNVRQTFFLMSLFLVVVIGVAWLASVYFGSPGILYIVILIALLINVFAYWRSDSIAVRLTRAREISRDEYFDYWNAVENLCISIGAPMPKLYVINDTSPNAFATGRSRGAFCYCGDEGVA